MTSTTDTEQPVEPRPTWARLRVHPGAAPPGLAASRPFAAGFSLRLPSSTTVFQLFFLGFGFGGAAFFWTWPVVFFGQLLVALELLHPSPRGSRSRGAIFPVVVTAGRADARAGSPAGS